MRSQPPLARGPARARSVTRRRALAETLFPSFSKPYGNARLSDVTSDRRAWLPGTQTLASAHRVAARNADARRMALVPGGSAQPPIEHAHERQARQGGVERRYE